MLIVIGTIMLIVSIIVPDSGYPKYVFYRFFFDVSDGFFLPSECLTTKNDIILVYYFFSYSIKQGI